MDITSYMLGKKAGGGTITETDPIFSASPAAGITAEDINNWNNAGGGVVPDISIYKSSITLWHFQYQQSNDIKSEMIRILNKAYNDGVKNILFALNETSNIYLYSNELDISTKPTGTFDFWGFLMSGTSGYTINQFGDGNIPALYGLFFRITNIVWTGDTITDLTVAVIQSSTSSYLSTTNTSSYTPTGNYHPATKKYVDDSITSAITTTLGGSY